MNRFRVRASYIEYLNPARTGKLLPGGVKDFAQRGFATNKRKSKGKRQKSKGKNLRGGPRAGLGRNLQGLAAIKTIVNDSIVNDSILERRWGQA